MGELDELKEIQKAGDDGVRRLSLEESEGLALKKKIAERKMNPVTNPQAIVVKQTIETLQQVSYERFGEAYPDSMIVKDLEEENKALRQKLGPQASSEIPVTKTRTAIEPKIIG